MQVIHHFGRASRWSWAIYAFFYAVLLNIPLWFAARTLGLLVHGWFCIDYLILGVLAILMPRRFIPTFIVLFVALDIVRGICETYFLMPSEMFRNLRGIVDFSPLRIMFAIVTVFLVIAAASIAYRLKGLVCVRSVGLRATALLIAFAVLCVSLDFLVALSGTGQVADLAQAFNAADTINVQHYTRTRFSRLPLRWLTSRAAFGAMLERQISSSRATPRTIPSAFGVVTTTEHISLASNSRVKPDIVLIVVESWGQARDNEIRDALTAPYADTAVHTKYQVILGEVPFYGATIDGEARELCGTTIGLHIMEALPLELERCLPDRLSALGYHTTAIHGMDGNWFDRRTWYPAIGFQDTFFRDRLTALGLPRCAGAFIGTCDSAIANLIGQHLSGPRNGPQFFYWMTLNSHLPVPNPPPLASPVSCAFSPNLAANRALCAWFQLEANAHQAIVQLAITATERPTIFIVVGDHAPPFSSPEARAQFSPSMVPFVALVSTSLRFSDSPPVKSTALRAHVEKARTGFRR